MTMAWNKLIPFKNLGLPYHGLIDNGVLTLPNSDTLTIPLWNSSPSIVIRSPTAPGITRSPELQAQDTAEGREYRNYALLTIDGWIGGTQLEKRESPSLPGNPCRIYIDPAGTPWLIEILPGVDGVGFSDIYTGTVRLKLAALFGRFSEESYPVINRELDSLAVNFDNGNMGTGNERWRNPFFDMITQNETGSGIKVNYYTRKTNGTGGWWGKTNILLGGGERYLRRRLEAVMTLTLSGTGSTDRLTLGDGITGSISLVPEDYSWIDNENGGEDISFNGPGYRNDTTVYPQEPGCPVEALEETRTDNMVQSFRWRERFAEVYVGNMVGEIKVERVTEQNQYVERIKTGTYWCCDGVGGFPPQNDTADGTNTLYRKNLDTRTITLADGTTIQYQTGYDYVADDITGVIDACCNCQLDGEFSWSITDLAHPPAPDTSDLPTWEQFATIRHDTVWFVGVNRDNLGASAGGWAATTETVSETQAPYMATNPELSLVQISANPIAYV